MNFEERAILYLKRNKSRSILLMLIIFVMSGFVLSGLVLRAGAAAETENVQKTLGSSFKVKINSDDPDNLETVTADTYTYEAYTGDYISKAMMDDITAIDGVTDYMIDYDQIVWTGLDLKPGLWDDSFADQYISQGELDVRRQSTLILPCNASELHENFRIGAFSIIEGNPISERDRSVAVISDRLAKRNNLKIGDIITIEVKEGLYQPSDTPSKTWGEPVDLKIIGLFSVNFEQEPSVYTAEEEYAENLIYTDWATGLQMKSYYEKGEVRDDYWEVTFFINEPAQMDHILAQVQGLENFNPRYFKVILDDTAYRATAKALNLMNALATILIVAGILGCMAILTLVLNMWTKKRKHEIGILLSIGAGKREIILQLCLECITVTLAALILTVILSGRLTGTLCSFAEKTAFPESQVNEYTVETEYGEMLPIISKSSPVAVHMDYTVSAGTIAVVVITTCLVSMASVMPAVIQIIKTKPKKLLQSL